MNNRIAKKVVKKYGASWWIQDYHYDNGVWIYLGSGFKIPVRWKNKKVEYWLLEMYNFLLHI